MNEHGGYLSRLAYADKKYIGEYALYVNHVIQEAIRTLKNEVATKKNPHWPAELPADNRKY